MSLQGQSVEVPGPSNQKVNMSAEKHADQLNIAPTKLVSPVYKLRKFTQVSGGSTLSLSTSPTQSIFNIPGNGVWNFSKSFIKFDALFAAIPVVNPNNIPALNVLYCDCLPVDSIQLLYDGRVLSELTNAQLYTKVAQHLATDLDDYFSRGGVYGDSALGTAFPITQITGCNPVAGTFARTTAQITANVPTECSITDDGASPQVCGASARPATNASGSDCYDRAPQRLIAGAANANLQCRYKVPLKAFLGTIFAMDKDLHFAQNLQLVINWADYRNFGFTVQVDMATNLADLATVPTITKYNLYLAEDIGETADALRNVVRSSGMNVVVPYTYCKPLTVPANSTNGTNSQPLTQGMGISLKRILTIPSIANADTNKRNNTFNVGGVKFTTIQSTLDGKPLQDQKLVLADSDVWNYQRELIKKSAAGLSSRTWEENCFFLDNFSDCYDSTHFYENDTMESGLRIDTPQKTYEVNIEKTTAGSITLNQYQTWTKLLAIRPDGIMWGS